MFKILVFLIVSLINVEAFAMSDEEIDYLSQQFNLDPNEIVEVKNIDTEAVNTSLELDATEQIKLAKNTDRAIQNWVHLAVFLLQRKGYTAKANQLDQEYRLKYWNK